jgi:hypothetical protein
MATWWTIWTSRNSPALFTNSTGRVRGSPQAWDKMSRFPDFTTFTASSAVVFFRSYSLFQFLIFLPQTPELPEIPPCPPLLKGGWGDFRGWSVNQNFLLNSDTFHIHPSLYESRI